jgi:hypothetical protein
LAGSVESLTTHDGGVNGREEGSHRVVLGHKKEVDGAVRARDVTIETDAEAEDDLPHVGL